MKTLRRSVFALAILASLVGMEPVATAASTASELTPVRNVQACCWLMIAGRWVCWPC